MVSPVSNMSRKVAPVSNVVLVWGSEMRMPAEQRAQERDASCGTVREHERAYADWHRETKTPISRSNSPAPRRLSCVGSIYHFADSFAVRCGFRRSASLRLAAPSTCEFVMVVLRGKVP